MSPLNVFRTLPRHPTSVNVPTLLRLPDIDSPSHRASELHQGLTSIRQAYQGSCSRTYTLDCTPAPVWCDDTIYLQKTAHVIVSLSFGAIVPGTTTISWLAE